MIPTEAVSATQVIADYVVGTSTSSLPEEVRDRAKLVIMDEMASAFFGRSRPAGKLGAEYARSVSAAGPAQVLGTGDRLEAAYAALANGTAGHADEIDGAHVVGGHPGATIVHSAVATAEALGSSGAELINAVVLGYDVGTRLLAACGGIFQMKARHHLHGDLLYALGAVAANARLLGLDSAQVRHALALATFQANGVCSLFQERRHISKAFCNGQYAFAGVSAARMAAAGLEGSEDVLGETHGVFEAWGIDDAASVATTGLGSEFQIMNANFKLARTGYPILAALEAVSDVTSGGSLASHEIASVVVGMPENAMRVVDNRAMHNICAQDMVSVAIARGGLSLRETYFPEIQDDPEYARIRSNIELEVDPELQAEQPNGRGARVTITTTDGMVHSSRVEAPRSHSSRGGVTWTDLDRKWHDALVGVDVDAMLSATRYLQDAADVRQLTETFAVSE